MFTFAGVADAPMKVKFLSTRIGDHAATDSPTASACRIELLQSDLGSTEALYHLVFVASDFIAPLESGAGRCYVNGVLGQQGSDSRAVFFVVRILPSLEDFLCLCLSIRFGLCKYRD